MIKATALTVVLGFALTATAAVTKVGNGDDGRDLEGAEKVESGKIVDAQKKAVELLEKLNIKGVRGLGQLTPEVQKTELYFAKKDVEALEDYSQSKYHSNMQGFAYARTFAEPHAPTRFFPAANQLDENQLVALQVHEALHRALPEDIREDEDVVSQITVAITSPGATFDRVSKVSEKYMPQLAEEEDDQEESQTVATRESAIPETAAIKRPSVFSYGYRSFNQSEESETRSKFRNMHTLESFLYPFGNDRNPMGIGIALSMAGTEDHTQMGPLGISGRMRLWSTRGFDIGMWGELALNTLSAQELKNSPYGRDVTTIGMSARKDAAHFYIENILGLSSPGKTEQEIGNIKYKYEFGSLTTAKIRAGGKIAGFSLGGFGEVILSDYYKVTGGEFSYNSGRFNIVSGGPELSFTTGELTMSLFGRFILSRTADATYDSIGYLMGPGAGDGFVGASMAVSL